MNDLQNLSGQLEQLLARQGVTKYALQISKRETQEFNAENGAFTLYRTLFDNQLSLTVYLEGRVGSVRGNDVSPEGLAALVEGATASARAAAPDPHRDLAPRQEHKTFHTGCFEPDMECLFDEVQSFLAVLSERYPLLLIMLTIASHTKQHTLYKNSNGTEFEKCGGYYHVMMENAANDGERTTGIDFLDLQFADLDRPLLERDNVQKHLEDTIAQLHLIRIPDKFTGTVILTPDCLGTFLSALLSVSVTDSVTLDGTSCWRDKMGEKVAAEQLTLTFPAEHPALCDPACYTPDGFLTRDTTVLEKGVLKSRLLSLYVSKKTGLPVAETAGDFMVVEPGTVSLEELIRSIDRGLIVGGFSGGEPETNGEFSGVAKNSFYVENGSIIGAVSETMINGNLFSLVQDITAVSREQIRTYDGLLPYLAAKNVVISGK